MNVYEKKKYACEERNATDSFSSSTSLPLGVGDHALPHFSVFPFFQTTSKKSFWVGSETFQLLLNDSRALNLNIVSISYY